MKNDNVGSYEQSADRPDDLNRLRQAVKTIAENRKSDGLIAYCIEIGAVERMSMQLKSSSIHLNST